MNVRVPRRKLNGIIALAGRNAQERIQLPRLFDFLEILISCWRPYTITDLCGARRVVDAVYLRTIDSTARAQSRIETIWTGVRALQNVPKEEGTIVACRFLQLNVRADQLLIGRSLCNVQQGHVALRIGLCIEADLGRFVARLWLQRQVLFQANAFDGAQVALILNRIVHLICTEGAFVLLADHIISSGQCDNVSFVIKCLLSRRTVRKSNRLVSLCQRRSTGCLQGCYRLLRNEKILIVRGLDLIVGQCLQAEIGAEKGFLVSFALVGHLRRIVDAIVPNVRTNIERLDLEHIVEMFFFACGPQRACFPDGIHARRNLIFEITSRQNPEASIHELCLGYGRVQILGHNSVHLDTLPIDRCDGSRRSADQRKTAQEPTQIEVLRKGAYGQIEAVSRIHRIR